METKGFLKRDSIILRDTITRFPFIYYGEDTKLHWELLSNIKSNIPEGCLADLPKLCIPVYSMSDIWSIT